VPAFAAHALRHFSYWARQALSLILRFVEQYLYCVSQSAWHSSMADNAVPDTKTRAKANRVLDSTAASDVETTIIEPHRHAAHPRPVMAGWISAKLRDNLLRKGKATMPIYEYACQDCGREFEKLVRSETVPECPQCHSTQLAKRLSVFATAASAPAALPAMSGPCGSCGHPDGPGSCALH